MTTYKVDQRHLKHLGREFHFVSYEGRPANPRRNEPALAPEWFLMGPGKRWSVMPHEIAQPTDEVDRQLIAWLDANLPA
jgi:hypothetical protein